MSTPFLHPFLIWNKFFALPHVHIYGQSGGGGGGSSPVSSEFYLVNGPE